MTTDVSICTSALLMVGADEIESFVDETREAKLCAQIYPTTKTKLLQSFPWRFSLGQVQLAQLATTPLYEYDHAYQLPAGFLRIIEINSPSYDYKIFEDKLYTNADTVYVTYQFDPGEEDFPEYFTRLLELEMASLLSVSLLEDLDKSKLFGQEARRQALQSRSVDSQSQPNEALDDVNFDLIQVRY
jgi:hypothetical protein